MLLRNLNNGAICDWTEERAGQANFQLLNPQDERDYFASPMVVKAGAGKPANYETDGVVYYSSGQGVGDAISALYTGVGLARAGHKVVFHARHAEWWLPFMAEEANLKVVPWTVDVGANCNMAYVEQLQVCRREGLSRSQWYMRKLAEAYPVDAATAPGRPRVQKPAPVIEGGYVLMAPFSFHAIRQWSPVHWARLITMLQARGQRIVVIGMPDHADICKKFFAPLNVMLELGRGPQFVSAAIANAQLAITVESGPAHICGYFGTPTLSLVAATGHSWLYDCAPSVTVMMPSEAFDCTGCYWQPEAGFLPHCVEGCSAMLGISPFQVAETAMDVLGKRKRKK